MKNSRWKGALGKCFSRWGRSFVWGPLFIARSSFACIRVGRVAFCNCSDFRAHSEKSISAIIEDIVFQTHFIMCVLIFKILLRLAEQRIVESRFFVTN